MTATATAMQNRKTALNKALRINKNAGHATANSPKQSNAAKAAAQAKRTTRIGGASANALVASDLMAPSIRPGSMDALACPSRVGDLRIYRDGTRRLDPIASRPRIDLYVNFNRS